MILFQRWVPVALACALVGVAGGCGTPGAPSPPSLNLPERVTDLSAVRTGNQVALTWTAPKKTTDKIMIKGSIAARVCMRESDAGRCQDAGEPLLLAPGAAASFSETMPLRFASGTPRPLRFFVEMRNHKGRSAGLSNAATVLAGAPPGMVQDLHAQIQKEGVVLSWASDDEIAAVRLWRKLLTPVQAKTKEGLLTPPPEP